jgi:glutathione S-transferase
MKFYYATGACSLAPHIVARELDIAVTPVKVDVRAKTTSDGNDYRAINPKGQVPALELPNGETLTEVVAIMTYLIEQKPGSNLIPPVGSPNRYRVLEWLSYISTEIWKLFWRLARPDTGADEKEKLKGHLRDRFAYVEHALAGKTYLVGETFSAADAFLFHPLLVSKFPGIDLSTLPNCKALFERVSARPAVKAAMQAEGMA